MTFKDDRWVMTEDDYPMFYLKETGINGVTVHYHEDDNEYSVVIYNMDQGRRFKNENLAMHWADPHFTKLKPMYKTNRNSTILTLSKDPFDFVLKDKTRILTRFHDMNLIYDYVKTTFPKENVTVKIKITPDY